MNPIETRQQPDEATQQEPKLRRRWLRWSMRGFFVAITLLCIVFGLIGQRLYVGLVHADVGRQLTQRADQVPLSLWLPSSDTVTIGWTIPRQPIRRIDWAQDNKLPTWMKWTGSDVLFRRLDRAGIWHNISDEELRFTFNQLHRLGELRELIIRRQLPSEDLELLLSPLKIQKLAIYPMPDQDEPYAFLHRIDVKDLEMHRAPVPVTEDLPASLESLDISGSDIDDDALARFVRLKNLKLLNLSGTLASSSRVEALRRQMPRCEIIWAKRIWQDGKRIEENPSP